MRKLWNFAAFQAGWFACVLGAAMRDYWIGPLVVAVLLAVHLRIARERRREWLFLAVSLPLGFVVDNLQVALGAIESRSTLLPALAPLWLLPLWPLFTTAFGESMSWMLGRPWIAAAFGAAGAPLSYWAGARTGALKIADDPWRFACVVGVAWAAAMPLLLALRDCCLKQPDARLPRSHGSNRAATAHDEARRTLPDRNRIP